MFGTIGLNFIYSWVITHCFYPTNQKAWKTIWLILPHELRITRLLLVSFGDYQRVDGLNINVVIYLVPLALLHNYYSSIVPFDDNNNGEKKVQEVRDSLITLINCTYIPMFYRTIFWKGKVCFKGGEYVLKVFRAHHNGENIFSYSALHICFQKVLPKLLEVFCRHKKLEIVDSYHMFDTSKTLKTYLQSFDKFKVLTKITCCLVSKLKSVRI